MRSFLIFLSVFIVFALVYYLLFYTITYKTKDIKFTDSGSRTIYPQNSFVYKISEYLQVKLSMKQIDSLTAFENYKFTIANYYKDVVPKTTAAEKTKII